MKKYAALVILLLFVSCTKQTEDFKSLENAKQKIEPIITNGTMSFKSTTDLYETLVYLSKLSTNKRKEWEETNGFYSIERRTEEGFEAIHKANMIESEEVLNNALKDYSDVIELRGDTYTPIYDNGVYNLICNCKGLFILSGYVQKVNSKNIDIYRLEDFNELNQGIEKNPIFSYQGVHILNTKSRPTSLEASYYDNPSGCKHDRRVYVQAFTYSGFVSMNEVNPDYPDGFWFMIGINSFHAQVFGTERNWLCNWSRYSTQLAYRNVSFSGYGYQNDEAKSVFVPVYYPHSTSSTIIPFTYTCADTTTTEDCNSLQIFGYFGYRILNEGLIYEEYQANNTGFISAHMEGSSRGVNLGVNWAVMDYNEN